MPPANQFMNTNQLRNVNTFVIGLFIGKNLSKDETQAAFMARLHLKARLERCVLTFLEWSWHKSDVPVNSVGHDYVEWKGKSSIRAMLKEMWAPGRGRAVGADLG